MSRAAKRTPVRRIAVIPAAALLLPEREYDLHAGPGTATAPRCRARALDPRVGGQRMTATRDTAISLSGLVLNRGVMISREVVLGLAAWTWSTCACRPCCARPTA
jgi:hypothetical protein